MQLKELNVSKNGKIVIISDDYRNIGQLLLQTILIIVKENIMVSV